MDDSTRRAPVQGKNRPKRLGSGTISWEEHLEAWAEYARRFGRDQSAERIAERGGFGHYELALLLHRPPRTFKPL